MTWMASSGIEYKLCLLDTNALSEILKNPDVEGKGFLKNFPPSNYAPCFTVCNLIEIRRKPEVYKKFLDYFSIFPVFLLKVQQMIIAEEIEAYDSNNDISILFNAFTSQGKNDSYDLKFFIDNLFNIKEIQLLECTWREMEESTLKAWLNTKNNFTPTKPYPNSEDAEKYMNEAGMQSLLQQNLEWCGNLIKNNIIPDINKFPSLKLMLYSLYYRLYDPDWISTPSEVTDILINSAVPYIDVFITEKFQANIISKVKEKVNNLNHVDIKRIRDIR